MTLLLSKSQGVRHWEHTPTLGAKICNQTQAQLLATLKQILKRQVLVQRKVCFIQGAGNLGRRWTCVPGPTPKILLGHESFSRVKAEVISVNHWEGVRFIMSLTAWGLVESLSLFRCYLIHSFLPRWQEGRLGPRSGHRLIAYSSFWFLWSKKGSKD